jgi:hypothetical protein
MNTHESGSVGPDGKKGGMAHGDKAGVAQNEVEGQTQDRENGDHNQDVKDIIHRNLIL